MTEETQYHYKFQAQETPEEIFENLNNKTELKNEQFLFVNGIDYDNNEEEIDWYDIAEIIKTENGYQIKTDENIFTIEKNKTGGSTIKIASNSPTAVIGDAYKNILGTIVTPVKDTLTVQTGHNMTAVPAPLLHMAANDKREEKLLQDLLLKKHNNLAECFHYTVLDTTAFYEDFYSEETQNKLRAREIKLQKEKKDKLSQIKILWFCSQISRGLSKEEMDRQFDTADKWTQLKLNALLEKNNSSGKSPLLTTTHENIALQKSLKARQYNQL